MIRCGRCREQKPASDFQKPTNGSYCRPCMREYLREYNRKKARPIYGPPMPKGWRQEWRKRQAQADHKCLICSAELTSSRRRLCDSPECRRTRKNQMRNEFRRRNPEAARAAQVKWAKPPKPLVEYTCYVCEEPFSSRRRRRDGVALCGDRECFEAWRAYQSALQRRRNPEQSRDSVRRRSHRVRAARLTARTIESEPYTRNEVAKRDGWRCGLCGKRIDPNLNHRDRMSLTIDHIVPLSKGGDDVRSNVQAAHKSCNSSKSDRVWGNGEQLRLVG